MTLDTRISEASQRLRDVVSAHRPVVFASSFGVEDMVILDLIEKLDLDVEIVTLDTGRLHEETHALIALVREKYKHPVRMMYPDVSELESFVMDHGNNAFYESTELRKRCCAIRKVAPLRRAIEGKRLWITGLRRAQSAARSDVSVLAYDEDYGLFKLNPLVDWTADEVSEYLKRFDVPTNALHAKGFPSIGCAPCTRAVKPGEDERSGRWWWEQADSRECGLHMDPQGRLVRATTTDANATARQNNP